MNGPNGPNGPKRQALTARLSSNHWFVGATWQIMNGCGSIRTKTPRPHSISLRQRRPVALHISTSPPPSRALPTPSLLSLPSWSPLSPSPSRHFFLYSSPFFHSVLDFPLFAIILIVSHLANVTFFALASCLSFPCRNSTPIRSSQHSRRVVAFSAHKLVPCYPCPVCSSLSFLT